MATREYEIRFTVDDRTGAPIKQVVKHVNDVEKSALAMGKAVGAGLSVLAAAFVASAKASIDFASNLGAQASQVGVTVEALQKLRFAASQSGASADNLDAAMERLARNISAAAAGNKTQLGFFNALGVSIKDLKTLAPDEIFIKLADGFARITSPADQARAATVLFGGANANLVNLLRNGSTALQQAGRDAEAYGAVLTTKDQKALNDVGDAVNRLETRLKVFSATTFANLIPAAEALGRAYAFVARMASIAATGAAPLDFSGTGGALPGVSSGGSSSAGPPGPPKPVVLPTVPDKSAEAAANKAKRDAEAFRKELEEIQKAARQASIEVAKIQLRQAAQGQIETVESMKDFIGVTERELVRSLAEIDAKRLEVAEKTVESIKRIEDAERKAVESARGNQEKLASIHREANAAIEREATLHLARLSELDRQAAERAQAAENKRIQDINAFVANAPTDASPDVKLQIENAKAAALDLKQVVITGLGQSLSAFGQAAGSAFQQFVSGTLSAKEAVLAFAEAAVAAIADVITQLLVQVAVTQILKAVSSGVGGTGGGQLAIVDQIVSRFATGGIVTGPRLAVVGDGNEPEAIVPLSKAKELGFGGGGISVQTVVNVNGSGAVTSQQTKNQGLGMSQSELGRVISSRVVETIRNEQRPGGLLSPSRSS